MNDTKTAEVITSAKELMAKGGWLQFALEEDGAFCAVGALCAAEENSRGYFRAITAIQSVIATEYPERLTEEFADCGVTPLVRFNNHPDTTWADVERVFEKAAAS